MLGLGGGLGGLELGGGLAVDPHGFGIGGGLGGSPLGGSSNPAGSARMSPPQSEDSVQLALAGNRAAAP